MNQLTLSKFADVRTTGLEAIARTAPVLHLHLLWSGVAEQT
jgi:hypothetical protein